MNRHRSWPVFAVAIALTVALLPPGAPPAAAAPEGQITFAVHISLAPTWFDPAETAGVITPFMMLYALHDALVKPMPGNAWSPSLAESWTASKDGLAYEFALRKGVAFHNGDAVTAEDVKFSFERYKGAGATTLKARVAAVEVVDAHRVRFRMKQPWPDFMTFYATPATGAAWIVPKKYAERVGEDGFKKAPVEAGPYRFVSFTPGIELVLEAYEGYWRKTPAVKRLVFNVITGGNRSYGGYPDIDALFRDQAVEMDRKRRETLLYRIQQLMHERAMVAPIVEPPFLTGVGPRIGEIPTIAGHPYFSPYEDLKLKGR
jgi:ABC-type transport system substrate-binding protein